MAFQSPAHANANALQKNILMDILGVEHCRDRTDEVVPTLDSRAKAELIRTWIELEHLKRELRGIPRLKPADVSQLLKSAKRSLRSSEPVEVESSVAPVSESASEPSE